MQKSLKLVFLNSEGKKENISISEVKGDITSTDVDTLVDAILASNVFGNDVTSLVKAVGADIVSKDIVSITY